MPETITITLTPCKQHAHEVLERLRDDNDVIAAVLCYVEITRGCPDCESLRGAEIKPAAKTT